MKGKGVSAIIATVLLLLITIGLSAAVYVYMSGMIGGRISKTITILDASCTGDNGQITLVISNDGTSNITQKNGAGDLKIFVDNVDDTEDFKGDGSNRYSIASHGVIALISDNGAQNYTAGTHKILIISPSNTASPTVFC